MANWMFSTSPQTIASQHPWHCSKVTRSQACHRERVLMNIVDFYLCDLTYTIAEEDIGNCDSDSPFQRYNKNKASKWTNRNVKMVGATGCLLFFRAIINWNVFHVAECMFIYWYCRRKWAVFPVTLSFSCDPIVGNWNKLWIISCRKL